MANLPGLHHRFLALDIDHARVIVDTYYSFSSSEAVALHDSAISRPTT
jgi:hypothetical protein